MLKINLPITESEIRKLKVGDELLVSGTIVTARDAAHKFMVEENADFLNELLKGNFIYHCGPVVKKEAGQWQIVAAGPTTSVREEPYEATVIEKFSVRGIIGKGGMGEKTLEACKKFGCVYLSAVGGLATILAKAIIKVENVYKLEEFGTPEAFWVLKVKDFPVTVTMDSNGNSVHKDILKLSEIKAKELLSKP